MYKIKSQQCINVDNKIIAKHSVSLK